MTSFFCPCCPTGRITVETPHDDQPFAFADCGCAIPDDVLARIEAAVGVQRPSVARLMVREMLAGVA